MFSRRNIKTFSQSNHFTLKTINNLWNFGVTVTISSDLIHNHTWTKRLQVIEGNSRWVSNIDKIYISSLGERTLGIHKSRKHLCWRHLPKQYISQLWNKWQDIFHPTRQLKILKTLLAAKSLTCCQKLNETWGWCA